MIHRDILLSVLVLILNIFISTIPSNAEDKSQEQIKQIIRDIDDLYRSQSSHGTMEMEIVNPNWTRTLSMEFWSEGMEKTLIRIKSPAKEQGVGTLRIENEMWNYLPKTNKVIKIPPSMMMSSWMGSDFTNDDLVKEFSLFEDYTYQPAEVSNPDSSLVYIRCNPRPDLPIVWGKIVIAARNVDHLPVWQKYFDEKGKMMRILEYSDIKTFDNRKIPAEMKMVPQNKDSHTVIRYKEVDFNANLDDNIFTLRKLRSLD